MLEPVARRIVVAGASGSGKTTLAARIGAVLSVPHTEIDGLHWRAGWTANPRFMEEVTALAAGEAWVTEFQYPQALPLLAARAQLLVWLRPPRSVVLVRVVRRTLRRRLRRELLWGVNLEPPLRTVLTDPDHVIRWSMRSLRASEERVRAARAAHPALRVVEVRTERDVEQLLRRLEAAARRA